MTDPYIHFDQSTWLAARALDAEDLGPAPPPEMVALPGAKTAIAHDRLLAHQDAGRDEHAIVTRENERWEEANADRLASHRQWVLGPYVGAIEELRKRAMEEQAEKVRREALFNRLVAERDAAE